MTTQYATFDVEAHEGVLGPDEADALVVFDQPGLMRATFQPSLNLIKMVWESEYDLGSGARDAITAALDFTRKNDVKSCLVDISKSAAGMKGEDFVWVSSPEFNQALLDSGLRQFVFAPPELEVTNYDSWVIGLERSMNAALGDQIQVLVLNDAKKIHDFLTSPMGEHK